MRRRYQKIQSREKINSILEGARIGRLSTIDRDGYPYITPLNFVYWNEAIYFHCSHRGEKLDNLIADNRVCFQVDIPLAYLDTQFDSLMDPCEVGQLYQSVVIRGKAEIVDELQEKVGALNALMGSHEGDAHYDSILPEMKGVGACAVVAVRIKAITGKENLVQNKSEEEKEKIRDYLTKRNLPNDMIAAKLIR